MASLDKRLDDLEQATADPENEIRHVIIYSQEKQSDPVYWLEEWPAELWRSGKPLDTPRTDDAFRRYRYGGGQKAILTREEFEAICGAYAVIHVIYSDEYLEPAL